MRSRLLWAGLLIVAAVGYLAYTGWQGATLYYLTATEATGQMSSLAGRAFRLSGKVADGSISFDPATTQLRFVVTDGQADVALVYHGQTPDNFYAGQTVVAEGAADGRGGMTAERIIVKCPSKYEEGSAAAVDTGSWRDLVIGAGALLAAATCVAVAGRLVSRGAWTKRRPESRG